MFSKIAFFVKNCKDKLVFITGGGAEPEIVGKIVELTGCTAVNGFKTSVPDSEIILMQHLCYDMLVPPKALPDRELFYLKASQAE